MRPVSERKNVRSGARNGAEEARRLRRERERLVKARWEPGLTSEQLSRRVDLAPITVRNICRVLGLRLERKKITSPADDRVRPLDMVLSRLPWQGDAIREALR